MKQFRRKTLVNLYAITVISEFIGEDIIAYNSYLSYMHATDLIKRRTSRDLQ